MVGYGTECFSWYVGTAERWLKRTNILLTLGYLGRIMVGVLVEEVGSNKIDAPT